MLQCSRIRRAPLAAQTARPDGRSGHLRVPVPTQLAADPGRGCPGRVLPVLPRQAAGDDRSVRGPRRSVRTLPQLGAALAVAQLSPGPQETRTRLADRAVLPVVERHGGCACPPATRARPGPQAAGVNAAPLRRFAASGAAAGRPAARTRRLRAARATASDTPLRDTETPRPEAHAVRAHEDRPCSRRPPVRPPGRRHRLPSRQPGAAVPTTGGLHGGEPKSPGPAA